MEGQLMHIRIMNEWEKWSNALKETEGCVLTLSTFLEPLANFDWSVLAPTQQQIVMDVIRVNPFWEVKKPLEQPNAYDTFAKKNQQKPQSCVL